MYTARWSAPAVALFLALSIGSLPAYSQGTRFLSLETKFARTSQPVTASKPCQPSSSSSRAAQPGDAPGILNATPPCDLPVPSVEPVAPCISSNPLSRGCGPAHDFVRDDLNTMGKKGHSILKARDKVLEILQSDNVCSAWYRTKDADPGATFRTLTFSLDRDGDAYITRVPESGDVDLLRSPYVARVLQGQGPRSTVTINEFGAFFLPMATVILDPRKVGPLHFQGSHLLQVGPYGGGTLHAQVVALLHEFGHVVDLLPQDSDNEGLKSPENTQEVLRYCRAEVQSDGTRGTLSANR